MKKIPSFAFLRFYRNLFFYNDGRIFDQNYSSLSQPWPCHSIAPQGFLSISIRYSLPLLCSKSSALIFVILIKYQGVGMPRDKVNLFPVNVSPIISSATARMIFYSMFMDRSPELFFFFFLIFEDMHFSWSISDCFKHFGRVPCYYVCIASVCLRPGLF